MGLLDQLLHDRLRVSYILSVIAFAELKDDPTLLEYNRQSRSFIKTGRLQFRAEAGTTQQHHTSPFHEQPQTRILLYYNTKTRRYVPTALLMKRGEVMFKGAHFGPESKPASFSRNRVALSENQLEVII